ncbi:hypothetical protein ACFVYR_04700 [Streptomyces sp. NPDC058284]|uniref:hypothetical protein n=1 Tax=unclassified Streptomyces TaxID=2593676 RepID=UPI00364E700C
MIALAGAAVPAGTTGAAFPAALPAHHRHPPAVAQEAPAPRGPGDGGTHQLIRDQIDIDLDENEGAGDSDGEGEQHGVVRPADRSAPDQRP